jgi:hypothetical protein
MTALGLNVPLDPPDSRRFNGGGIRLAMPATAIDLAAMSLKPARFTYAVSQDKAKYGGAVSKASSPLCVLAGNDYLDDQPAVITQMKEVIKAGFDVNAKEFEGNAAMATRVTGIAKSIRRTFTPSTPLEKACDALFLEAAELLISKGAKVGNAAKALDKFDDPEDSDTKAMVAKVKVVLGKATA